MRCPHCGIYYMDDETVCPVCGKRSGVRPQKKTKPETAQPSDADRKRGQAKSSWTDESHTGSAESKKRRKRAKPARTFSKRRNSKSIWVVILCLVFSVLISIIPKIVLNPEDYLRSPEDTPLLSSLFHDDEDDLWREDYFDDPVTQCLIGTWECEDGVINTVTIHDDGTLDWTEEDGKQYTTAFPAFYEICSEDAVSNLVSESYPADRYRYCYVSGYSSDDDSDDSDDHSFDLCFMIPTPLYESEKPANIDASIPAVTSYWDEDAEEMTCTKIQDE